MYTDEELLVDELNELFDELPDIDIVEIYNNAVDSNFIYYMDSFDEVIMQYNYRATELVDSLDYNFSTNDYYFTIDDNREIHSFTDLLSSESPFDRDVLIGLIVDNANSYNNAEVDAIIDRFWVD